MNSNAKPQRSDVTCKLLSGLRHVLYMLFTLQHMGNRKHVDIKEMRSDNRGHYK